VLARASNHKFISSKSNSVLHPRKDIKAAIRKDSSTFVTLNPHQMR